MRDRPTDALVADVRKALTGTVADCPPAFEALAELARRADGDFFAGYADGYQKAQAESREEAARASEPADEEAT